MSLSNSLREYIAACFTGLWIQSHEHEDALAERQPIGPEPRSEVAAAWPRYLISR